MFPPQYMNFYHPDRRSANLCLVGSFQLFIGRIELFFSLYSTQIRLTLTSPNSSL